MSAAGFTLRPYQQADLDALRQLYAGGKNQAVVYQLPTGGGKTIVFAEILRSATQRGRRSAVITHRRELIRQASAKLATTGVPHGIIAAGQDRDHDAPVLVCSIDTIRRRSDVPAFDFIVIDEAHHARAVTWQAFLESQPQAKLLGVTATPARTDHIGLGRAHGGLFDALHCGPTISFLQTHGFLSRTRTFIPPARIDTRGLKSHHGDYASEQAAERASVITGDAVREYARRADHQAAIAFCCTIKHAEHVAQAFCKAGYRSAAVHGGIPTDQRDHLINGLGTGQIEILTACEIISEGVDVPSVSATILLRPTKSLVLYLQQIGRGMRPAEGKTNLTILDHAANSLTHGLPEEPRSWSLHGIERPEEKEKQPRQIGWLCRNCDCLNPPGTPTCLDCGSPNPNARKLQIVDGELIEAEPAHVRALQLERVVAMTYRQLMSKPRTEAELRAYAKARNYRRGWVHHRLKEQAEWK